MKGAWRGGGRSRARRGRSLTPQLLRLVTFLQNTAAARFAAGRIQHLCAPHRRTHRPPSPDGEQPVTPESRRWPAAPVRTGARARALTGQPDPERKDKSAEFPQRYLSGSGSTTSAGDRAPHAARLSGGKLRCVSAARTDTMRASLPDLKRSAAD
ncbi:hypothetical protein OJAV_G00188600 [Oryzias javanicus]|uniref:Uncharacterized protein n=1 Tax=Oryzias javanicus TaxID=123683 RepID=A0A437CAP9_ORYJA|nr:hypothetical protein OJAV_G00188600 [Oryzias javanicus]